MKKLMSIILAGALVSTLSVSAFAYETRVTYETTLEQEVDADGDGNVDGTITDETPFILVVPEEIAVNGEKKSVHISGVTEEAIRVAAPPSIEMLSDYGSALQANIEFGTGQLVLPVSLTTLAHATSEIGAEWSSAPLSGAWSGNFVYTID